MKDKHILADEKAQQMLRFTLLGVCLLIGFLASGSGVLNVFLIGAAFLLGRYPTASLLPFVQPLEERRRVGREVLMRLSEAELAETQRLIDDQKKIAAIKHVRAIHNDGLREAKEAVELLEQTGANWRSV